MEHRNRRASTRSGKECERSNGKSWYSCKRLKTVLASSARISAFGEVESNETEWNKSEAVERKCELACNQKRVDASARWRKTRNWVRQTGGIRWLRILRFRIYMSNICKQGCCQSIALLREITLSQRGGGGGSTSTVSRAEKDRYTGDSLLTCICCWCQKTVSKTKSKRNV